LTNRHKFQTGAVASPHWQATEAGKRVLQRGGNALDACIAMNAMLAVVYPHMCGLGGDLFLTYFDARRSQIHCLNGSGRAPALATPSQYASRGFDAVPARGSLSITVPGALHGWQTASQRFGSRPLSELLEPAIRAASSGVEVTSRLRRWIDRNQTDLSLDPTLRGLFLDADGAPPRKGSQLQLPELAATLKRIAKIGPADFYSGEIARAIDRAVRDADGLLRFKDLASHTSDWVKPVSTVYDSVEIYTTPPNSQGITALQMLNVMHELEATGQPPGSADQIHTIVAAKTIALADRNRYIGDPRFVDIPVDKLLSRDHARASTLQPLPGNGSASLEGDTVYVCAVDNSRNVSSLIQSIYYPFGSAFVAGETGVLLHNRGHYFSFDPESPNVLMPGKRPLHTLIATLGLRRGRPWAVWGTMGADGQPQTIVQVLLRLLAGSDPQEAVSAPRFLSGRFVLEDREDQLLTEENIGAEVLDQLRGLGHDVNSVPPLDEIMGHAHAIVIHDNGKLEAGSDPRSDGRAVVLSG
jgi:gamma-glutamyltranspeptidase / glutathione hydrolase